MIDILSFILSFKLPANEKFKAKSFITQISHLRWKITKEIISEDIDALEVGYGRAQVEGMVLARYSCPQGAFFISDKSSGCLLKKTLVSWFTQSYLP